MITLGMAVQPAAISGFDHFASLTLIFSTSSFFATFSLIDISMRSAATPSAPLHIERERSDFNVSRGKS
ncbi:hypothetical protein ACQPTN_07670 [Bradyrhizobium sp. 13971]